MTSDLRDAPAVVPYARPQRPRPAWAGRLIRLAAVALGLAAWFGSQALIGGLPHPPPGTIGDAVHRLTAPVNNYLLTHRGAAHALLIASSAIIDALGLFLLAASIFGRTIRPFLGLLILFGLRQSCQLLCTLPPPAGMIWEYPGSPSLLVTYGVSSDLFFSGHTALAVYGGIALARAGGRFKRWLTALGIAAAVFEVVVVLVLRAHYTMDVFAGAMTAFAVAFVAERAAPPVDRWLGRLASGRSRA